MENFNNDDLTRRKNNAEQELFEMHSRSAMPPVPPFVRTPSGDFFENQAGGSAFSGSESANDSTCRSFQNNKHASNESGSQGYNQNAPTHNGTQNIYGTKPENDSLSDESGNLKEPPKKRGTLFGKDLLKIINLKDFEMDSDRMLLLLMILLLSENSSDEILLLALAYLML